jgi:magnesium transporter
MAGSVAGLAMRDVPIARPEQTAAEVRAALADRGSEPALDVVIVDGDRLVGVVPIERLLAAPGAAAVGGIVTDDEAAARRALGAVEERVLRRLRHRLPWLLVGLAGAMLATLLVGAFEQQLEAKVVLAFFVPGVVYMADAVGTQTEALLIRGLAAGVRVRDVAVRELVTGLALGIIVGGAFLPFAWLAWAAASVALALVASCSIATAVAMALPWLFQRLGRDPAFGSGPLATVVQDLLSIAIYFAIASELAL